VPGCSFLSRPLAKCSGNRVATQNHDASGRLATGRVRPNGGHGCLYRLTGKHRLLAAANFEFVAIRVFEKEGVVTRTVAPANFRPIKFFPASVAHDFRNPIHFLPRIGPKRDSCAIRFVVFVWTKAKEFRRSVAAASGKKSMEVLAGSFVNKSKLWQKFPVELFRHFHVFHPQIDVIEATRFHVLIFNLIVSQFNCA
jgi:hypothetical protein